LSPKAALEKFIQCDEAKFPLSNSFEDSKVAAIFLLRDDGALLLQHRDNKPGLPLAGKWAPPGGHCEADEDMEVCARRELREETDYDCAELNLLGLFLDDNVENYPAYLLTVFWARYDGVQKLQCFEGQAIEFVRREEISNYEIPQYLIGIWDRAIDAFNQRFQIGLLAEEKR